MLQSGLAWWYAKYSDSVDLANMQDEAKEKRIGLWSATEEPWKWRNK